MPHHSEVTYIRLHDKFPEHPKIAELSDAAFRLFIEALCYSNRLLTDGRVPGAIWKRLGTEGARKQLIATGLVRCVDAGAVEVHDYLHMQRSAAEVAQAREAKSGSGSYGNHKRWHVDRAKPDPACEHCRNAVAPAIAPAIPNQSQKVSRIVATTETEPEGTTNGSVVMSLHAEPPRGAA